MDRRRLLILLAASTAGIGRAGLATGRTFTGSGVASREARDVGPFTAIALSVPALVELTQGDRDSVLLEADDNIVPLIDTVVENGNLKLRFKDRTTSVRGAPIRIIVTARNIEALAIAGTGDIRVAALRSTALAAKIAGSGDIRIGQLDSGSLQVTISGSGDFTAAGKTDSLQVRISGSGNVKTGTLASRRADINIAGSGNVRVWALDALAVKIAGVGDVGYYGDPSLSKSVAGSGSVKRIGAAPA